MQAYFNREFEGNRTGNMYWELVIDCNTWGDVLRADTRCNLLVVLVRIICRITKGANKY